MIHSEQAIIGAICMARLPLEVRSMEDQDAEVTAALATELDKKKAEMKSGEAALNKYGGNVAAERLRIFYAAKNLPGKKKYLTAFQAEAVRMFRMRKVCG